MLEVVHWRESNPPQYLYLLRNDWFKFFTRWFQPINYSLGSTPVACSRELLKKKRILFSKSDCRVCNLIDRIVVTCSTIWACHNMLMTSSETCLHSNTKGRVWKKGNYLWLLPFFSPFFHLQLNPTYMKWILHFVPLKISFWSPLIIGTNIDILWLLRPLTANY